MKNFVIENLLRWHCSLVQSWYCRSNPLIVLEHLLRPGHQTQLKTVFWVVHSQHVLNWELK
jgi:hypothetical protein